MMGARSPLGSQEPPVAGRTPADPNRTMPSSSVPDRDRRVAPRAGRAMRTPDDRPRGRAWLDPTAADARFHRLLEAAPDGIVAVDRGDRVVLANAEAECLFGSGSDELIG